MKIFDSIFLFTSTLLLLASSVLALDSIRLEGRSTLERRETIDCKGSGMCKAVVGEWCQKAAQEGFVDSVTYWSETRRVVVVHPITQSYCLAMYKCENPDDYKWGMSGAEIRQKFRNIYDVGGCKKCGTAWFWGSCRVTLNYCQGGGCGTA
ncbi:hypothetical protein ABW19_dt0203137 [Dactylella cylindrospora]|nr:hypothetical protein ABW19_dt0203137 [Dactylella cylindrospora]